GWGVRGVKLTCTNTAATGIESISALSGDSHDFMINECKIPYQPSSLATAAPGTSNTDQYGSKFRHFVINLPAVAGAIGINESSNGVADVDFEKWIDGTVTFDTGSSITRTCIYAGYGDTNVIENIHCIIVSGRSDTINGITLDYSANVSGDFPNAYIFRNIDLGAADTKWQNVGTPSVQAPNYAEDMPVGNGGGYTPGLLNLLVDHASGTFQPTLLGDSVTGSPTYVDQLGAWVVNGQEVNINFFVDASSLGTAAGNLYIGNLPFTAAALPATNTGSCTFSRVSGWTSPVTSPAFSMIAGEVNFGQNIIGLYRN